MEKNTTLQQFFDILMSKIIGCFVSKNRISTLVFLKNENVDYLNSKINKSETQERAENFSLPQVEMSINNTKIISRIFHSFWITFLLFAMLPFSAVAQCPNSYVCTPTVGATAATITFKFDAGNAAADRNIACDFVRKHGGTGTDPCNGGSITVAGITYNYTGNSGGANGNNSPITLTYTATIIVTNCPTDIQIAEGIGCSQTSYNECLSVVFQDIITGQNCTSSNSFFSMTLKDNNNCGPYTLISSGNSALVFNTSSFMTGTYTTGTIKAGIYIFVFTDMNGVEHSFIYNHITEIGTCLRESNLNIAKTITSGNPFSEVGDIITYEYAVTSDAPITNPFVVDDHIVGNITSHTGDSNSDGILQVGETWIFTGAYTVTQDDIDNGSVTNIAYSRGLDQYGFPIFSEVDDATASKLPCTSPTIDPHPTDQTKCVGENASFTVESSGGSPEPTIQWQVFVPNGSWANIGGETNAVLTLTEVTIVMSGNLYRAVLTSDGCPSTNSNSALLTVNPTPSVNSVGNQTICKGANTTLVTFGGTGTSYTWANDNTAIGLGASGTGNIAAFAGTNATSSPISGTITVTPHYLNNEVTCDGPTTSFTITVNPTPSVDSVGNQTICKGANTTLVTFGGTGTSYTWANDNTAIGLGASGTGNIPAFAGTNATSSPISGTITVTPHYLNNEVTCDGPTTSFTITVNPTPSVTPLANKTVCKGDNVAAVTFSGTGTSYDWVATNLTVGLPAISGTNSIGAFSGVNLGLTSISATITVTPQLLNGSLTCPGTPTSFMITVNPKPALVITTPTIPCSPGTIDLTALAITANSTLPSGTTFSYYLDNNGVAGSQITSAVAASVSAGTYWIKATAPANVGGCTDIKSIIIPVNNCGGLIYPTATTCTSFLNNQPPLDKICYTVTKKGTKTTISNATPGVFFYYAKIIAPSTGPLTIEVIQFNNSSPHVKDFAIQLDQVFVFDNNCTKVATGKEVTPPKGSGQAKVTIPNAIKDRTYVISVKYDTKTIIGQTVPTVDYHAYFISRITSGGNTFIDNTTAGDILVSNCSAPTPFTTLTKTADAVTTETVAPTETTTTSKIKIDDFTAYPVPFKDQLTIRYNFDYTSDVKIEIFNAKGNLVITKYDANGYLNKEISLNLTNTGQEEVYIIKVTTNRGSSVQKVISSR
ncbi:MAG TPA: T9SS type A sorting domain-containing protein [Flavobacterium sp.]|nr:T9SS type A sorting domain-containing protein [Flavobacterium sp.]